MANFTKHTVSQMYSNLRHVYRVNKNYSNTNIDEERREDNVELMGLDYQSALNKYRIIENNAHKMNRKDVITEIGYCVSLPLALIDEDKTTQMEFWNICKNQLIQNFGKDKIISMVVHYDEERPHLHCEIVPLIWDEKKQYNKFCAKEVLNRKLLQGWHSQLQKEVSREFGEHTKVWMNDGVKRKESIKTLKKDIFEFTINH